MFAVLEEKLYTCSVLFFLILTSYDVVHRNVWMCRSLEPKAVKPSTTQCVSNETWLSKIELVYVVFLLVIQVYCIGVHGLLPFTKHLEFFPLLLTSVSCAVGIVWTWLQFYTHVLFN